MIQSLEEDEGFNEIPVNFAIKTVCDHHAQALAGKNEKARNFMLMAAFMDKLQREAKPETNEDIAAMMGSLHKITQPVCCYIGEEAFAQLVAAVPQTSGDPARDEEVAILMAEGNVERVRQYPEIGEQVPIEEGGTVYLMSLGEVGEEGHAMGNLMSIVSRVINWEEKELEVLTVGRHKTMKAAHQWFREKMNEKKWLHGEPS